MYRTALNPIGKKFCTRKLAQQASGSSQTARASFSSILQCRRSSPSSRGARSRSATKFDKKKSIDELVVPLSINDDAVKSPPSVSSTDVGKELTGDSTLTRVQIANSLNKFLNRVEIRLLCEQHGLGPRLFNLAFLSFRNHCLELKTVSTELYVLLHDLQHNQGHVDDLLPHFMDHAKKIYPHLECLDDLKKVSDLRLPHNWYPEARGLQRKIIFHAGPTNSGKTYQALKRFMEAKSGVYCGPLKMLASEVFYKTNEAGVPCDLITGEERRAAFAARLGDDDAAASDVEDDEDDELQSEPSPHMACTIEMLNTKAPYDVAIIDEIQMLRDQQRGWAWTRALLGVNAKELHLCGEAAAVNLVRELLFPVNEEVEVFKYKRKSPLRISSEALGNLKNVRDGDCLVVFSKGDLYRISREIEKLGREVAVIYGSLPPATKLAQAMRFNDPSNPCKVLVATDAIGMGLNLNIKRIIFTALSKPTTLSNGERKMDQLTSSMALQIAGRAGRFGTIHEAGEVTTLRKKDLPKLQQILSTRVDVIEKAGLYPTVEQMETFSYYLPKATLSNLMDIFVSLCSVDESRFFMCNVEDFKYLASMIEHVPNLSLQTRYKFCLAPVNTRQSFVCQQFVKMARKFSTGESLTWLWLKESLDWNKAARKPNRILDLIHLEMLFDVMDIYLYLGCRFQDAFLDQEMVRAKQAEIVDLIEHGIGQIASLLSASGNVADEASAAISMDLSRITASAADNSSPAFDADLLKSMSIQAPKRNGELSPSAMAAKATNVGDRVLLTSLKAQLASMKRMSRKKQVAAMTSPDNDDDEWPPVKTTTMAATAADQISLPSTSLTRRLIRRGLLTPNMIDKLRREWADELTRLAVDDDGGKKKS